MVQWKRGTLVALLLSGLLWVGLFWGVKTVVEAFK